MPGMPPQDIKPALRDSNICARVDQLPELGMVIPPLIGNLDNGYIIPYYWVDDHSLLYGEKKYFRPQHILPFLKASFSRERELSITWMSRTGS